MNNGVYIQDVTGKLWKTEDWDGSVQPNAIAVITPEHKFRISLTQLSSRLMINSCYTVPWENTLTCATHATTAKADYNGAYNTQQIITLQPSTAYAAGACNAYTFPDGVTKGYLPACGELYLAYQNKAAIDAALTKCGGTALSTVYYHWSSTFHGSYLDYRYCWMLSWYDGDVMCGIVSFSRYVRAFASLEF